MKNPKHDLKEKIYKISVALIGIDQIENPSPEDIALKELFVKEKELLVATLEELDTNDPFPKLQHREHPKGAIIFRASSEAPLDGGDLDWTKYDEIGHL